MDRFVPIVAAAPLFRPMIDDDDGDDDDADVFLLAYTSIACGQRSSRGDCE